MLLCLPGCRSVWQHPDRVVESLALQPGDHVADIGAGHGYFVLRLADAVGPDGRVYAVEVTPEKLQDLQRQVARSTFRNVEVVLGELDDPRLPDKSIDLAFVCNTYHHIDDRPAYFARLQGDLSPRGRVAIVDLRDDVSGLPGLFLSSDHSTARDQLFQEMTEAGYEEEQDFDFLPFQHFVIFGPRKAATP